MQLCPQFIQYADGKYCAKISEPLKFDFAIRVKYLKTYKNATNYALALKQFRVELRKKFFKICVGYWTDCVRTRDHMWDEQRILAEYLTYMKNYKQSQLKFIKIFIGYVKDSLVDLSYLSDKKVSEKCEQIVRLPLMRKGT